MTHKKYLLTPCYILNLWSRKDHHFNSLRMDHYVNALYNAYCYCNLILNITNLVHYDDIDVTFKDNIWLLLIILSSNKTRNTSWMPRWMELWFLLCLHQSKLLINCYHHVIIWRTLINKMCMLRKWYNIVLIHFKI